MLPPSLTGGIQAPAGLGQRGKPRRQTARQRQILNIRERTRVPMPQNQGPAPAIAQNAQPELGRQLTRRVQAGNVAPEQAQQVAQQRALLEKAYGPQWRVKLFGDRGYVQRTRSKLQEEPENTQVSQLYKQLMQIRQRALARAEQKYGAPKQINYESS